MLNFASLFSQFRSQAGGLGDLLDQPGVRIGRLLDEEAFLNEYKSASNPKVAEFMTYERYEELIEFVTVVGPPDDKKRSYKYPLAACDLLCLDHPNLIENLFPSQPIRFPETVVEDVEEEVDQKIQDDVPVPIQKEEVPAVSEAPSEDTVHKEKEEKISEGVTEQLVKSSEQPKQPQPYKIQTQKEPQVAVVKNRKVKVTRKQERIVEKELPPLIDRLMGYFNGEVNYILAGYVSKVLLSLLNKKTPQFIEYFLQLKFTEAILSHAESRSVGDLIVKVLTRESQTCLPQRKAFFQVMLRRLSDNSEVYIMSNLSAYVVDVIETAAANLKGQNRVVEFADIFFSIETVTQIIRNVMSDNENVSVYSAPALFAFLTSVPFVMPEDEAVRAKFTELVEEFIEKSCVKLNVRAQDHPRIGLGRMKVVEILRFVLKEDILNSRQLIAKRESFFEILLTLLKEYPLSSLLHNQIVKIIELAIADSQNSPLNQAIIRNNVLLNFIMDQVLEDKKIRAGESVYKSRKGFIAHLINIATKLRETAQQNSTIRAAIGRPEYSEIYQSFLEKEIFNSKKPLAGFLIQRGPKQHQIKFQKEDIIAAYATFLKKCPPPVFDEPEPTADSHPDLVQELQKQIEESLNIKNKEEKHETPKPVEGKLDSPASRQNKQQWVLSYDIEQIVLDW